MRTRTAGRDTFAVWDSPFRACLASDLNSTFEQQELHDLHAHFNTLFLCIVMKAGPKDRILSSLPLQMLVYFEYYWLYFFFALEILSYIYKGIALPYPSRYVGTDIPLLVLLCLSDFARLYIGSHGNKTQQKGPLFLFILITALMIVLHCYFLLWQTYILRLEQVINAISIIFNGLQIVCAFIAMIAFMSIDSL